MMDKKNCIKILLPALLETKEQIKMTAICRKSLISLEHCIEIIEDNNKYKFSVAEAWERFFDTFRGHRYNYLMITANDTEMDCRAIDFGIRCLEEHPEAGVIAFKVERDHDKYVKGYGQGVYDGKLSKTYKELDPACFILRKGVIEKVGEMDFQFPCEFCDRDYWYRCKLAGLEWIQLDQVLCYHPPVAGTIGNSNERLQTALRRYVLKWGGDAGQEKYLCPYQNFNLDYTSVS